MKTALVTGSNGYIGKLLVKTLRTFGWVVIEFDNNVNSINRQDINFTTLEKTFERQSFSHVFHLAATTEESSGYNYQALYATNALSTIRLFELCKRCNKQLIFTTTNKVLGKPQTPLEMSKRVAEFHLQNQPNVTIVSMPDVIGTYDGFIPNKHSSHFESIINKVRLEERVIIEEGEWCEYALIEAVIKQLMLAAGSSRCSGKAIIVPSSICVPTKKLVHMLGFYLGKQIHVEEVAVKEITIDNDLLETSLNFDVLIKTIEAYLK